VKAAYYQARRELSVREAPDPEPGPNEVLVRVAACGICGTDQHIYDGDFFPSYPLIGGHELAGEVVALGPPRVETALHRHRAQSPHHLRVGDLDHRIRCSKRSGTDEHRDPRAAVEDLRRLLQVVRVRNDPRLLEAR